MKNLLLLLPLVILVGCRQMDPPEERKWWKGNLHTHSFWSDGDDFPEMIMDRYKSEGYHFVALSDHNILAQGEKWIGMAEDTMLRNAFQRYLDKYGEDWIEHKEDSGRLSVLLKTLEEYRPLFEEEGRFLIIQAEEITDRYEDKEIHMNASNIDQLFEPRGGSSVVDVLQNNIDAVLDYRDRTGKAAIVHVNHPNFHYSISLDDMIALEGERFFEVYNGHPLVHNQGDSTHIGTEEMWDLINLAYHKNGKPLIYGLATDDSHNYHRKGSTWSNAGRGWIMVQADTLTPEALIGAMESGRFYGSTGVVLQDLINADNTIALEISAEEGVEYKIDWIGAREGDNAPTVFKSETGQRSSFSMSEDVIFVRARITSDKRHSNPVENLVYEMAWTQPFEYSD